MKENKYQLDIDDVFLNMSKLLVAKDNNVTYVFDYDKALEYWEELRDIYINH